jgi:hypothetical protein
MPGIDGEKLRVVIIYPVFMAVILHAMNLQRYVSAMIMLNRVGIQI